jgi:hypothetical protein
MASGPGRSWHPGPDTLARGVWQPQRERSAYAELFTSRRARLEATRNTTAATTTRPTRAPAAIGRSPPEPVNAVGEDGGTVSVEGGGLGGYVVASFKSDPFLSRCYT